MHDIQIKMFTEIFLQALLIHLLSARVWIDFSYHKQFFALIFTEANKRRRLAISVCLGLNNCVLTLDN